ncbi:MAG: hypothetical protein Q4D54_01975 [Eubacteriales bacterium]|nr:hypothetical protein [Eubacteriales bacterium]
MTEFMIKTQEIAKQSLKINEIETSVESVKSIVESVKNGLESVGLSEMEANLEAIETNLGKHISILGGFSSSLKQIVMKYLTAESSVLMQNLTRSSLVDLAGSVVREPSINNDNSTDGLPPGYNIVDNMDGIPMSKELYDRIYGENGLAYLHGSETPPDGYDAAKIAAMYIAGSAVANLLGLNSGELLNNFFFGDGSDYYYDATEFLFNKNVNEHYTNNIESVAAFAEGYLEDGQTITLSVDGLRGCDGFLGGDHDEWNAVLHANTFAAINQADAGIVCEITRNGDQYEMTYKYYIIDHYDFEHDILPELYDLNKYGYATNFVSIGEIDGYVTWNSGLDSICYY